MLDVLPDGDRLLQAVREALAVAGSQSFIIGIDGRPGAGKSSAATWLGWQLGLSVVALELFTVPGCEPEERRYEDLGRVLATLVGKAAIVEGDCLCEVLQALDRDPDFLVWIDNQGSREHGPEEPTDDYVRAFDPAGNADFTLTWSQPQTAAVPD